MMAIADRWLLPDGVEEVLPPQAKQVEHLRRDLLDLFQRWGYDLVIPPQVEFLESLLTGAGHDLELQTFKVTDQLTGRMMGFSADITPQVARIDAHSLRRKGPCRLSYCSTTLHTRAASLLSSRTPMQIGVELYGSASIASDLEVLSLMIESIERAGIKQLHVDLGHVEIFRSLSKQAQLSEIQEKQLFDLLQHKALTDLETFIDTQISDTNCATMIKALANLNGGITVLAQARKCLVNASAQVHDALDALEQTANTLMQRYPQVDLYFDLSELRGYNYHTGMVFAAYAEGHGEAVAKGGRYDEIGGVFGRPRPATGFSADLKVLATLSALDDNNSSLIYAPVVDDAALNAALWQKITMLRAAGESVICALADQAETASDMACERQLSLVNGQWQIESLN